MPLRLYASCLLVAVAGCTAPHDGPPAEPSGSERSDRAAWAAAHARWETARPDGYAFTLSLQCECPTPSDFAVVVDGRKVTSVEAVDLATGATIPRDSELNGRASYPKMTVDDLFALLDEAIDEARQIDATYDATYGFPVHAQPDVVAAAVDGSVGYSVSGFEAR